MYLRLLEPAPGAGGVFDQASQVDERGRPVSFVQSLDQVVAANQAPFLILGAAARLHVAVLLARDEQDRGGLPQRAQDVFRLGPRSDRGLVTGAAGAADFGAAGLVVDRAAGRAGPPGWSSIRHRPAPARTMRRSTRRGSRFDSSLWILDPVDSSQDSCPAVGSHRSARVSRAAQPAAEFEIKMLTGIFISPALGWSVLRMMSPSTGPAAVPWGTVTVIL